MKPVHVVLAASAIANAALFAALTIERPATPATPPHASVPGERTTTNVNRNEIATIAAPTWNSFYSGDVVALAARLKDAGFPREIVRAIVQSIVAEQFTARRDVLRGKNADLPYWRFDRSFAMGNSSLGAFFVLAKEERATLTRALGQDYMLEDESMRARKRREYGIADEEKLTRLLAVERDYQEVQLDDYSSSRPGNDKAGAKTYELLQKEKLADIAAVLTPGEFAEFEMRQGNTTSTMQQTLSAFRATEDEFRILHPIFKTAWEKLRAIAEAAPPGSTWPESPNKEVLEQAKAALSPERFADFEQALTIPGTKLPRLLARLNVPLAAAKPLLAIREDISRRAEAVRNDSSLASTDRATQLAALAGEAQQKITDTLGQRGFTAYHDYVGEWMDTLGAKASPPPSP